MLIHVRYPSLGIPRNRDYPHDAVLCGGCGGYGMVDFPSKMEMLLDRATYYCELCDGKGWLPSLHDLSKRCYCGTPLKPSPMDFYPQCSSVCNIRYTAVNNSHYATAPESTL